MVHVDDPLNREGLAELLDRDGFSKDRYSFYGAHSGDAFVVDNRPGGWVVFYSERGGEEELRLHHTEDRRVGISSNVFVGTPSLSKEEVPDLLGRIRARSTGRPRAALPATAAVGAADPVPALPPTADLQFERVVAAAEAGPAVEVCRDWAIGDGRSGKVWSVVVIVEPPHILGVGLLVGCSALIGLDPWRFPARAWRVAGHRPWAWKVFPISLVGLAFLPLGVLWFRVLILAALASCILYLAKVRPMLQLAGVVDTVVHPRVHDRAAGSIVRIDAQPGRRPTWKQSLVFALNFPQKSIEAEETQPRVVAVNGRGEERILFVKSTWEEAVEASGRVHDDLARMSPDDWRRHYGVPPDFVD